METSEKPKLKDILENNWPVIFKSVKVIKVKWSFWTGSFFYNTKDIYGTTVKTWVSSESTTDLGLTSWLWLLCYDYTEVLVSRRQEICSKVFEGNGEQAGNSQVAQVDKSFWNVFVTILYI